MLVWEEVGILFKGSLAVRLVWAVEINRRIGAELIIFTEVVIITMVTVLGMAGINRDGTQLVVEAFNIEFGTMGLAHHHEVVLMLICYNKRCRRFLLR
jgi:hypothetical protein